ncbi:1-acyl-sn-glycerol-3-phosphate acyltransferase [Simiduia aestuariiviva]|uniref:1-acyl-sn-glycerol-3-phosphate acyltransferase n=1 Tax=Simiduia aestuariiviva TaxID=1510459 RepID=A0A839UMI6_9GAMM|nr:1-acyl-sn-glycerol-3-phosphate acyltransferase [Simiduia aestuariiviva]MBB3167759.1 1-acyl-sn-glycerol-3-phosphate acyltransferase [Simiduia aestuariiviva]
MTDFDDIRPYRDDEVAPVLARIVKDPELQTAVAALKFPTLTKLLPWLMRPLVAMKLKSQLAGIETVHSLQELVSHYLHAMLEKKSNGVTASGLEKLDRNQAYLFVSNHRDIAMDPAMVNYVLFQNQFQTLQIAIGDNLLTKPYVSDLMRLNKSFIVNRSAKAPREKLKAAKYLSSYIHHALCEQKSNVWVAQREGRAKDGRDKTNSAVVGMFALSRPKTQSLGDYLAELKIVPVSISYEWDPCDLAKSRELYVLKTEGSYQKGEHEDVASIAAGINGHKGRIHLSFGDVIQGDFKGTDEVAAEIDRQVLKNYVLHPSNCLAFQLLTGTVPAVGVGENDQPFNPADYPTEHAELQRRIAGLNDEQRDLLLGIYANPVQAKLSES